MKRFVFCFAAACAAALVVTHRSAATDSVLTTPVPYTWRNVQIVGGGFVTGIISHPARKGLLYARTDVGGAYRWEEREKRWQPITDGIDAAHWTFTGIESLAVDPSDPNRVYLAAGTYSNDWSGPGAIFRSNDQGRTWARTELPFKNGGNEDGRSMGERLQVDPHDGRILFFGTRHDGLWRSADRGATWTSVASFPHPPDAPGRLGTVGVAWVLFDARGSAKGLPTQTLYAGTGDTSASLLRSRDGGKTWQALPGQPTGFLPHHAVLDPTSGALYVTYSNGPGPNGVSDGAVWKCDTANDTWTNITPVRPGPGDAFGYAGLSLDARHPNVVMVSTLDRWTKKDTLFRSRDGGKTWTDVSPSATRDTTAAPYLTWGRPTADLGHWIGDLEIDPFDSGHVLYVTGTGIWASRDADALDGGRPTHWTAAEAKGIEECVVNTVISPPGSDSAPLLSATWDIDGFRHERLDESPREGFLTPSHGHDTDIAFAGRAPDVLARVYGANDRSTGGAYSLDNGRTWTEFAAKPSGMRGDGKIALSADGKTLVWSPENAIPCVSRDHGTSWAACEGLHSGLRVIADSDDPMRFSAYDRATGTLLASTDGGATFSVTATGLPKSDGTLCAVPGQTGHLWLATDSGIWRSTEGGAAFTSVAPKNAAPVSAHRLGWGKAAPGRSYPALYLVGTVGGVYGFFRSDDEGASYVRVNDDAHQFGSINSITGDPRVWGRLYVASANRGVLVGEPK